MACTDRHLDASLLECNGFIRFTLVVTPVDLLVASMTAQLFMSAKALMGSVPRIKRADTQYSNRMNKSRSVHLE